MSCRVASRRAVSRRAVSRRVVPYFGGDARRGGVVVGGLVWWGVVVLVSDKSQGSGVSMGTVSHELSLRARSMLMLSSTRRCVMSCCAR